MAFAYLFLSLLHLSSGEQASCRDTSVKEGAVVTSTAELRGDRVESIGSEPILKESLRFSRPWRTRKVECGTITVVDPEHVIGRSDHVEVKVKPNLLDFAGIQSGDIVLGTKQAKLLCRPEAEPHCVVDAVRRKLERCFEDANDTRPIVVDTWASKYRVRVSTDSEDIGLVSADSLRNDVVSRTVRTMSKI